MAGRQFAAHNRQPPACIQRMGEKVPACFTAAQWSSYLRECWRQALSRAKELAKLERGQVPDYCSDCSSRYRTEQTALGTCHPPARAEVPPLEQSPSLPAYGPVSPGSAAGGFSSDSAGELHMDRSDSAARVAEKVAAEAPDRQQRERVAGASDLLDPVPQGNAQRGDASSPAGGRRGSAEKGASDAAG